MDIHVPEFLYPFETVTGAIIVIAALGLVWLGAAGMAAKSGERLTTAGLLTALTLGWFAFAQFLGRANAYWAVTHQAIPTIQFGLLIPIAIGLYGLIKIPRFARLVEAVPLWALVGVQLYRTLGAVFLVLWRDGKLPWQFALPAGIGDIVTGVLAPVVAYMLAANASGARRAAYLWCLFGIADLVVAVTMGTLTSPGLTNLLSRDTPNVLISTFPLVMIPTFAVPLALILHGLTLWRLRREPKIGSANTAALA
jgi:hypothetical protein